MKSSTITSTRTVIQNIPEGMSEFTYRVVNDAALTLVLVAKDVTKAETSVHVTLAGAGSETKIIGIVVGKEESRLKLHTMQIHTAPNTTSDLLVKTVLSGHAACLYDGGIRVEKSAQKTDAYQRNENLLLSDKAYVESKPSLEILANDVRCTHGATVGPVDPEQVWYLSTRGISAPQATHLIAAGFIQSALNRIVDTKAKRTLQRQLVDAV